MSSPEATMTVMDHLRELRTRLIRCVLAVAIGMMGLLAFYDPVKNFLTEPYVRICTVKPSLGCDGSLYSLGPLDGFATRLRICTWGGVVVALPVILWELWRFVVPALEKKEKRYAVPFIVSSVALFALGSWIAYWTMDKALDFLISWSGSDVTQAFQVSKYVQLIILMMLAFGIGFLSPVFIVFLQLVSVVTPRTLLRQWRYAVMGIFVVSAVITPSGDPISMLALAIPLTVLYLLSILVGWLVVRRRTTA